MSTVTNLIEPNRLLLSWQRPMVDDGRRTRRVVGEITRIASDKFRFQYLDATADFAAAKAEGFQGYPSFRLSQRQHEENVLDAFMVRLPSRKRGDFKEYLTSHSLPPDFTGSDFALLAHTGGRLPGDGFEVFPDISTVTRPFDLVIEIAGTRHRGFSELTGLQVGDSVTLIAEPTNPVDPNAITITHDVLGTIGYVPKPYCEHLLPLINDNCVKAVICKLNGRPERRLVYVLVSVG